MPFTPETFSTVATGSYNLHIYVTSDDIPTISTAGYIDRRRHVVHKNDLLFVITDAGGTSQIAQFVVVDTTVRTAALQLTTGAGVTGLTNPLTAALAAAGLDINDVGEITLRDTGGGTLTIGNDPATGGLLVNGNPISADLVNDTTPQLGGPLDAQNQPITNVGLVDGRDVAVDGANLDALQTASGLTPAGTTQFPAATSGATNIPAGTAVSQIAALAAAVDAAGGTVTVQDEGGAVDAATTTFNFTGGGVTASQTSPGVVQVAIASAGSIAAQEEGVAVDTAVTTFNFIGGGVTATQASAGNVSVTLGADLNALEALTATAGVAARTAADTWVITSAGLAAVDAAYNATTNAPDLTAAANQADAQTGFGLIYRVGTAGTLNAGIPGAGGAAAGDGDLLIFMGAALGFAHIPASSAPAPTFTPAGVTAVQAGGKATIDSIPFAGAVAGDGFVVGPADGTTLRDNLIDVQAYYESDGFVFLELDSAAATAFDVPAQQYTIYKINGNAPTNVPGTITGLGNVAGLAPIAGGAPGTSSTVARSDHQHPPQTAALTPFATTTDLVATNTRDAVEEVKALISTELAPGTDGSVVVQSGGDDVRVHLRIPVNFRFAQNNGELARLRPSLPWQLDDVALSVEAGGPVNFTAATDSGPGTASTDVTGIVNIAANTVALTSANATGANTGTANDYFTVTLSGAAGLVTGYLEAHYRWTGV